VPKVIPEEIKARIRELLISGETASAVVRAIANDGVARVSVPTVAKIAQRLGIKLVRGSVPGSRSAPRAQRSRHRERVKELRAAGMTISAIAAAEGISKQAVSALLSDDD
jgi:DNA invertase Pin-like site-specific DNA recombinase